MHRFKNLLIATSLVASGLGLAFVTAQPAYATTLEKCGKVVGTATLNPGVPVAKAKDVAESVDPDGITLHAPSGSGIFTVGADNPNSKVKSLGGTGIIPAGEHIASVIDSHTATLAVGGATPGPTTIKLTRLWVSTVTQDGGQTKEEKCSGVVGDGTTGPGGTASLVFTTSPTTTPGNCTTLATVTTGQTSFAGPVTITWPDGKTSNLTITAKTNGQLSQEALTGTIDNTGTETALNNQPLSATISFAPNTGDCVSTPITDVTIAKVTSLTIT